MIEALDPRSAPLDPPFVPLAPRPDPAAARWIVIRSMAPGSGVGSVAEAIATGLRDRYPDAVVEVMLRAQIMSDDPEERASLVSAYDAAIYVAGPAATMVAVGMQYAGGLEAAGLPTTVVVFDAVVPTIESALEPVGAPVRTSRIASPPRSESATRDGVDAAIAVAIAPLRPEESASPGRGAARPRVFARGDEDELQERCYAAALTDGLPVVLPTEARLARMLAGTSHAPDEIVTETIRPLGRPLTVETVALNAVMAGATPELLPFILAASRLMGHPAFESMTRSVNSFSFAQLVSGPLAAEAGFNGGLGALSPGRRANAATGRALGLVVRNGGGALIGPTSTPTIGANSTWSLVFAEHPDSPWGPRIPAGFTPGQTTSSLYPGGQNHGGSFYYGDLDDVAAYLNAFEAPANGAVVMLSLKRARFLAEERGMSRADVEAYLEARCTTTLGEIRRSGFWHMTRAAILEPRPGMPAPFPRSYVDDPEDTVVPRFAEGGIEVLVVGDDSSNTIQVWSLRRHATALVDDWV